MRRALLAAAALAVVGALGMVLLPMLLLTTYNGMSAAESVAACGNAPASSDVQPVAVNAGNGPGPGGISAEDWAKVQTYANAKQIDPLVLVSIGMHETDWGLSLIHISEPTRRTPNS